jgi:hypothetical protein
MDGWVQGFDPTIQGFWETGYLRNFGNRNSGCLKSGESASGRDDVNALRRKLASELNHSGLV